MSSSSKMAVVPAGEAPSENKHSAILVFCDERRMSVRSRLEVFGEVCSLVAAAHAIGTGFARIAHDTVTVGYFGGGLTIEIAGQMPLKESRPAAQASAPPDGQWRRFTSADMVRVINVFELGTLLGQLMGHVTALDPAITALVDRMTNVSADCRLRNIDDVAAEVARLRKLAERSSVTSGHLSALTDANYEQRWWSWA